MSTDASAEDLPPVSLPFQPGSDTSRAAARRARSYAVIGMLRVFACIMDSDDGAICDEVVVLTGLSTQTVTARLNQLTKLRWIRDSGQRRRTRLGGRAKVHIPRPATDRLITEPQRDGREVPSRFYLLGIHDDGSFSPLGPWSTGTARDDQVSNYDFALSVAIDISPQGEMLVTRVTR